MGSENDIDEMSDPPRIMMYTQDSLGLGHLRRATNLANSIVEQREDASVLLVVDSPVAPFFELSPHIDFIKLPTVIKVDAGVFRSGRLLTRYDQIKRLRSSLISQITEQFCPHLLVVDHMPGGANRELMPTLEMIRETGLPTRKVLGLRDIIDRPDVTRGVWQREGVYDAMEEFYDDVLIYGTDDVFSTVTEYDLPPAVAARSHYCGYICNMDPVKEPDRVREKLGLDDAPIVAVMAGGGADAFHLMQAFLEASRLFNPDGRLNTVMITGPFMPEDQRRGLRELARDLNVQVKTSIGDTLSQINAADVVVSMAGYNTLSEILRFGTKAVIVPRPGPSAEQTMRARLFEQRGLVHVLEQADLCATSLADAVQRALAAPTPSADRRPSLAGVASASGKLVGWLPRDADEPAREAASGDRAAASSNGAAQSNGSAASSNGSAPPSGAVFKLRDAARKLSAPDREAGTG